MLVIAVGEQGGMQGYPSRGTFGWWKRPLTGDVDIPGDDTRLGN